MRLPRARRKVCARRSRAASARGFFGQRASRRSRAERTAAALGASPVSASQASGVGTATIYRIERSNTLITP